MKLLRRQIVSRFSLFSYLKPNKTISVISGIIFRFRLPSTPQGWSVGLLITHLIQVVGSLVC